MSQVQEKQDTEKKLVAERDSVNAMAKDLSRDLMKVQTSTKVGVYVCVYVCMFLWRSPGHL